MKSEKRQRSDTETRPFPLRMTLSQIDDLLTLADECSHSGNLFMIRALESVVQLIKAPPGKPIELPEFLATARFAYHYKNMKDKPVIKG